MDLDHRELLINGSVAPLGERALEVLGVLLERPGELVTKDAIIRRIWPGAVVEDNTLEVHVWALRKAFGVHRHLLKTAYARGYRLLGDWTLTEGGAPATSTKVRSLNVQAKVVRPTLPLVGSSLIGRTAAVQHLCDLLSAHRLITLTGAGGIGKTRLALEAAHRLTDPFAGNVCFVQLASLSDPALVPTAVAHTLGLRPTSDDFSAEIVAQAISDVKMLLVLDNCEHVIDAAAKLTDRVSCLCPRTVVLATSREMLRVDGEHTYRVPPLTMPTPQSQTPAELVQFSAIEFFLTQMRLQETAFSPSRDELLGIAEICRRLDGIPLAIEFAAARAVAIGVRQVAAGLNDRFKLLTVGRRTALPRHQTLKAAIDWSYDLLSEEEAGMLRNLAVFAGQFTLDAAAAIAVGVQPAQVIDLITSLVSKSLVVAEPRKQMPLYRLLETIRVYGQEQLRAHNEYPRAARLHAQHFHALSVEAAAESRRLLEADWLASSGQHLDDWRAALDWAFSPLGEAAVARSLTADLIPIWFKLSLMRECRGRVEQALMIVDGETNPATVMRLRAGLAASLFYTDRGAAAEIAAAWADVLQIADRLNNTEHCLWARWGLWNYQLNQGACEDALESARQFMALAADPGDLAIGDRMIGISLHYLGQQARARQHLEQSLGRRVDASEQSMLRMQYHPKLAARSYLPRILWLQGFPDQAGRAADSLIGDASDRGHLLDLSLALVQAGCPVALLNGDLEVASGFIATLFDKASTHGLGFWRAECRCYEGILRARRGDVTGGLEIFNAALQELVDYNATMNVTGYLAGMAAAIADSTEVEQGQAMVDDALSRATRDQDHWCLPELLRLRGIFVLREGNPRASAVAETQFRESLALANRQDARSWALRSATSLAKLLLDQERGHEALAVLAPVYGAFSEGFGTADLLLAKQILNEAQ